MKAMAFKEYYIYDRFRGIDIDGGLLLSEERVRSDKIQGNKRMSFFFYPVAQVE